MLARGAGQEEGMIGGCEAGKERGERDEARLPWVGGVREGEVAGGQEEGEKEEEVEGTHLKNITHAGKL